MGGVECYFQKGQMSVMYYFFLSLFTSVKKAVEFYVLAHTCTDIARLQERSSSPVSHTNTIKRIMCRCGNLGWRTSHAEHTHASTQLRPLDECELRYLERKALGLEYF